MDGSISDAMKMAKHNDSAL